MGMRGGEVPCLAPSAGYPLTGCGRASSSSHLLLCPPEPLAGLVGPFRQQLPDPRGGGEGGAQCLPTGSVFALPPLSASNLHLPDELLPQRQGVLLGIKLAHDGSSLCSLGRRKGFSPPDASCPGYRRALVALTT